MAIEQDELQLNDFLKRAEVRTMKKDLLKLREQDALREKEKFVKTIGEAKPSQEQKNNASEQEYDNKIKIKEVLGRNEILESGAKKQIKNYANETEKQQIFILESQKIDLKNQIQKIREENPQLLLKENELNIEKNNLQEKIAALAGQEQKIQGEAEIISKEEGESKIPSEKRALEQKRWEIDDQLKEVEKKRWEVERQVVAIEEKIKENEAKEKLLADKEVLIANQIAETDKKIREIYSKIVDRVEAEKEGRTEQQKKTAEEKKKTEASAKENIQRQQWTRQPGPDASTLNNIPEAYKKKVEKSFEKEIEQRKQFIEDINKSDK